MIFSPDGNVTLTLFTYFRSELDSNELGEIRDTVNSGWPLGSDRCRDEIESALKCAVRPPKRGQPVRSLMPSEQSKPFG